MDETGGGKDSGRDWDKKHTVRLGRKLPGKRRSLALSAAKGNVVARALSRVTKRGAEKFVREMMSYKVSLLATDESFVYRGLREYSRHSVKHSERQYVVGAVHTNTIEGFWSIFKCGIVDSFQKVSAKYLPFYVAEFRFRYDSRFNAEIFGTVIEGC